jgi:two-component system cell cycle sensor histidine kinase/response regulator CckA
MSAGRRLLIVDDEPAVLDLLKRYLERSGYAVEITPNAEAALDLFQAAPGRFDLVITDLNLPGMGGEELLKRMRQQRPSLRALISSGYPHQPLLPHVGFLLKPYLPKMFVEAINELLK